MLTPTMGRASKLRAQDKEARSAELWSEQREVLALAVIAATALDVYVRPVRVENAPLFDGSAKLFRSGVAEHDIERIHAGDEGLHLDTFGLARKPSSATASALLLGSA